ncbi:g/u mismatch-specific uracil dna glycosylase [Acrodontium crateriforme]|uniref:G/u mismatch-specific uracil dna glycosylase n=1 Tax=Acrodontium crateriforme TaxID=150365 RepID=A0AAQ3M8Z2_9PEZI|nr:g/u mismatch-specific uracil dna glycosylase [Acrodontium crateriforme]
MRELIKPEIDENVKTEEPETSVHHFDAVADFKTRIQQFQYANASNSPVRRSERSLIAVQTRDNRKRQSEDDNKLSSSSHSKQKKKRPSSKYTPPSTYAHLPPLPDILAPGLICIFVGTNPGVRTALAGHTYAHPSNMFWKLLHSSGCTERRLRPEEDGDLPRWYAMGNTNLVSRPSRDAGELSKQEMAEGTPILEGKIQKYRPEAVCIVGKGIWEGIWRWRHQRELRKSEFKWGWQDESERMGATDDWEGAVVFVATSTSGLSASLRPPEKEEIWRPFGEWVKERRKERFQTEGKIEGDGYQPS